MIKSVAEFIGHKDDVEAFENSPNHTKGNNEIYYRCLAVVLYLLLLIFPWISVYLFFQKEDTSYWSSLSFKEKCFSCLLWILLMLFVWYAKRKMRTFSSKNKEQTTRHWFYSNLPKTNFLSLFLFFKDDDEPIDLLIRDDETLVKFSNAIERYKQKKLQIKQDDNNANNELGNEFKLIINQRAMVIKKQ